MIKSFAELRRAFDLEWIPDLDTIVRRYHLPPGMTNDAIVDHARQQVEDYHPETNPRPFLPLPLCSVVAIGVAEYKLRTGAVRVSHVTRATTSERQMLERFAETTTGGRAWQLLGFNSTRADLKLLLLRAGALGARMPTFATRPSKPWEGKDYWSDHSDWHVDLRTALCGYYGRGTLADVCAAFGLPGKDELDGSQIWEAWRDGRVDDIGRYVEADAMRVLAIATRLAYVAGRHPTGEVPWPADVLERHPEWRVPS